MASSNRHWPSMFKSKPCNTQQWQPHGDINPSARSSSSGVEERSPEPKPRWNPRQEQIQILESIFNSGLVNPPRDEIRKIRAQLQEYGEVGDANVFYWFQNRKSRSKHKNRSKTGSTATAPRNQQRPMISASSSNSSTTSSDKASPKKPRAATTNDTNIDISITRNINNNNGNNNNNNNNNNVVVDQFIGINNSPTSVNQCCSYFQPSHDQFVSHQEPTFFPLQQSGASVINGGGFSPGVGLGFGHDPISNTGISLGGGFSNLLLGQEVEKLKFQQELSFFFTNSSNNSCILPTSNSCGIISSNLGQTIGVGESGGVIGKSTVFVDNMMIEVPSGSFNVREYFGEDAILVYPSGHPVITNEWGVTVNPLQNGGFYYIVRPTIAASPLLDKLDTTPDLLEPEFPY